MLPSVTDPAQIDLEGQSLGTIIDREACSIDESVDSLSCRGN